MIDRMVFCCEQLIAKLEGEETQEADVQTCMNEFIMSVNEAWLKFEQGQIDVEIRQLPKPMYMFVTQELQERIKIKEEKTKIIKELKLFLNLIAHVLNPVETEEVRKKRKK
ncbi:MAG: hypothetical protein ACTSSG_08580 [Candidatus Heimdallarchaeaceae archaeon]